MKILVINSGSSSLKYQLFDMDEKKVLAKGGCERIGTAGNITHKVPGRENYLLDVALPDHDKALEVVFQLLIDENHGVIKSLDEINAVGHRVAHGGKYTESARVDKDMIDYLESIVPINPLHGPAAIKGMNACLKLLKNTPQCAVFDTSFYAGFDKAHYIYPIPYEYFENDQVRRYGFHGTSHRYVTQKAAEVMGKDIKDLKIISCHLGNGSSITATLNGKAIDTTMGFTPQEGLIMGTRSGDIDPTIIPYLMRKYNLTPDQMDEILNKKSGLLAVSGLSNDFRNCIEVALNGHERAKLAIDILKYRVKKYIGAFTAEMNGLDCLIFTAGISENNSVIREYVASDMEYLGIELDKDLNTNFTRGIPFKISKETSKVDVWVIPTDEEYMIALDTERLVK